MPFITLLTFTTVSAATTISTDITTTGKIGIGSTTPYSKLSIDASGADTNPFSIKTNGSAGNYISTNSAIFMYDASGAETLRIYASDPDDNNYNSANLYIGYKAGLSHPTDNVSAGYSNTGIGYKSLYSYTGLGFNTAIGAYSLVNTTTGAENTAIGTYSLYENITGYDNVAVGSLSLNFNRSATSSTAVGSRAGYGLSSYSNQGGVYLGFRSGYSAGNSSDYNTLIGYQSGYGITTGKNNIVLGTATSSTAIANLTTGSQNIMIGNNISFPSATASGQLNIGNIIYGTGVTGTGSTISNAKIGIGTTSPLTRFHVTSGASATTTVSFGEVGNSTSKACFNTKNTAGTDISFYFVGTSMIVESNLCR
jgi:hypothetical protein